MSDENETGVTEREAYDRCVVILNDLRGERAEHEAEHPDCPVAPLCAGPVAMISLGVGLSINPSAAVQLVLTAASELNRMAAVEKGLRGRLDVQRDLAASLTRQLEAADGENQILLARIDALGNELATRQAELDAWDDAAGIVGPVLPVIPEVGP